jgi:hypothetical protein
MRQPFPVISTLFPYLFILSCDIRALQLLQMEYRGEIELTHHQRRAAEACLPFETPKLGVVATTA